MDDSFDHMSNDKNDLDERMRLRDEQAREMILELMRDAAASRSCE